MSKILCIDTATDICSVALTENGEVIDSLVSANERSHARILGVYIQDILHKNSLTVPELAAVAISMGPGSYTGLRIGVSVAKGLCYGANKPLIAVSTLESMCYGVDPGFHTGDHLFCPMIDARRMEVYTCIYNKNFQPETDIHALIVDEESLKMFLDSMPVILFGSGADKLTSVIRHPNAKFYPDFSHSAKNMAKIAHAKLMAERFEDVAYFEPFYLKDFVATVPKKSILK